MGKITFVVVIYLTVTTAHKTRNVKSLSVICQQSVLSIGLAIELSQPYSPHTF